MAQQLSELCTLLVDDLYGELSSQVFSTLIQLGRVSLSGLAKNSTLTLRQLKNGLAVLIQQNLAFHYTSEDDDTTYYEANWQYAYALVRSGKIIQFLEERYGEEIGSIVSNLLLLGHTKIDDLADAYGVRKKRKTPQDSGNGLNGDSTTNGLVNGDGASHAKPHIQTLSQLHTKLRQLLVSGYLIPVHERHFQPPGDIRNEATLELLRTKYTDGVRGPKKQAAFQEDLNALLKKWRDEKTRDWGSFTGYKRGHDASMYEDKPRKRRKVNGGMANGASSESEWSDSDNEDSGSLLDGDLVVRINFEKCDVALRSQILVSYASKYLGETTAKVYEAYLRCLEEKIPRCIDEYAKYESVDDEILASSSATNQDVLRVLSPDVDLAYGIKPHSNGVNGEGHDPSRSDDESDDDILRRPNMNEAQRRAHLVDMHMHLLSCDPRKFVRSIGNRGGGDWKVDFRTLSETLLQDHLEATVQSKFGAEGSKAAKVIRVLFSKGKLDEKQVAQFAMYRQKDVRVFLTHLQEAGYVDCQEVPKDNSRTVNKTMFFWFYDQDRCRKMLLSDTYKAMARVLQRIRVERSVIQPVIDKAERLDVVGREEEYLTTIEKEALKDWSNVEEKLLAQVSRLDDCVAIIRDIYMPPL